MKRIFIVFIVALFAGGMIMAQESPKGVRKVDPKVRAEQRAERMTEHMSKKYALNEKQQKELKEANLAFVEKIGDMPFYRHHGMRPEMKKHHKKCCCECGRKYRAHTKHRDMAEWRDRPKHLTKAERVAWKDKMEKKREEVKSAREAYQVELQKIMTKEQYDTYSSERRLRGINAHR
ncbi:MAG: DUF4890 domain-containing protein [Bacteroides sp.]|nr:DUF4890 domain-containing protein [Bacteroides sp.]MCI1682935.1 DUF4890 domain-containing protein [Bacteroides sp.]